MTNKKITITNKVKEALESSNTLKTQLELILKYLQQYWPKLKYKQDGYGNILFFEKEWCGNLYGCVCEISIMSTTVFVDVSVEGLGTVEFGEFLLSIYPNHYIKISVIEYREKIKN